jgi:hypothetical protein
MTGEAMAVFPRDPRDTPIPPRQIKTSRTDGTIPLSGPRDLDKDAPYDPLAQLEEALRNSRLEEEIRNATKINPTNEDPPMATPERPYIAATPQPPRSELDIQFVNKICRITGTLTTREDFERAIGMLTAWTKFFPSTISEKQVEAPTLSTTPPPLLDPLRGNIVRPPQQQETPGV